jgi:hypothetical protein
MYMCTFNSRFRPLCVAIAIQGMAAKSNISDSDYITTFLKAYMSDLSGCETLKCRI